MVLFSLQLYVCYVDTNPIVRKPTYMIHIDKINKIISALMSHDHMENMDKKHYRLLCKNYN